MPARLPLGNDIVDLRDTHNRASAANRRFIARTLAPEEREALPDTAHRDAIFWAYWAAKEAAYKALHKTDPAIVFAHRRFLVQSDVPLAPEVNDGFAAGTVRHGERCVTVTWNWTADWMHCLTGGESGPPMYRIGPVRQFLDSKAFLAMRKTCSLPDASIAARLLALSLLDECGIGDVQIRRRRAARRQGPPQVTRHDAVLPNVDISLSHDGRYAAAAVSVDGSSL